MKYSSMIFKTAVRCLVYAAVCGSIMGNTNLFASDHGAEVNPTGNPLGGGPGYNRIVSRSSARFIVSDKAGLKSALATAVSGNIVYVEDSAQIDMAGEQGIGIPAGVTLASGRGLNGSEGARLYVSKVANIRPLFQANGSGVRVTGLRIFGPDMEVADHLNTGGLAEGINSKYSNCEVDNCELAGWGYSAICLRTGDGNQNPS